MSSLKFDPTTHEPYIQLPPPHSSIRITPPRLSDAAANTSILQHPLVYPNLIGPPFPYVLQDAIEFIESTLTCVSPELERIRIAREKNGGELPGDYVARVCPMKSIREIQDDGSDIFIGDITFERSRYEDMGPLGADDPARRAKMDENAAKDPGDPTIEWTFGDVLSPTHHSRGIISSSIHTILSSFAIRYLNARRVTVLAFVDNIASQKTFLKNGFVRTGTVPLGPEGVESARKRGRESGEQAVLKWICEEGEGEKEKDV